MSISTSYVVLWHHRSMNTSALSCKLTIDQYLLQYWGHKYFNATMQWLNCTLVYDKQDILWKHLSFENCCIYYVAKMQDYLLHRSKCHFKRHLHFCNRFHIQKWFRYLLHLNFWPKAERTYELVSYGFTTKKKKWTNMKKKKYNTSPRNCFLKIVMIF